MSSSPFHIVVLEDNGPDLVMIRQSLREAGRVCEITAFTDGADAMLYIKSPTSPVADLMILDFNVPGASGASVLNSVRGNPRWAHAGVFLFTASQDPGDIARVKMLGADDCLIKPMDLAGFARIGLAVKEWLEKSALTASAPVQESESVLHEKPRRP
jgi:CheY-like chemotaxis protein